MGLQSVEMKSFARPTASSGWREGSDNHPYMSGRWKKGFRGHGNKLVATAKETLRSLYAEANIDIK